MGIHVQHGLIDVPKDDPFKHDLLDRREAVETLTHVVTNLDVLAYSRSMRRGVLEKPLF